MQLLAALAALSLAGCQKPAGQQTQQTSAKQSAETPRFGVAVSSADGVCLSIVAPPMPVGTRVSLVTPTKPQSIAVSAITGPGPGCAGFVEPGQANYTLRIDRGKVEDHMQSIAVVGGPELSVTPDGQVTGNIDSTQETFKDCTSQEGVHLTVWKGKPLEGIRLWHGYYHLDYDTDANCTEKETAQ